MKVTLLKVAETRLANLLSASQTTRINSFRISSSANVTISDTGSDVTGSSIYLGIPNQVSYCPVSQNEIIFRIELDHIVGNYTIGNVMMFLDPVSIGQSPIPFLWATIPVESPKNSSNFAVYTVGNRVLIFISLWFPSIINIMDMSIHQKKHASFRQYFNEILVPSVEVEEYDQITIGRHTLYDGLSLLVKDSAQSFWYGSILSDDINSPTFNTINGGIIGKKFGVPVNIDYINGANFKLPNNTYPVVDGGNNWAPADSPNIDGGAF